MPARVQPARSRWPCARNSNRACLRGSGGRRAPPPCLWKGPPARQRRRHRLRPWARRLRLRASAPAPTHWAPSQAPSCSSSAAPTCSHSPLPRPDMPPAAPRPAAGPRTLPPSTHCFADGSDGGKMHRIPGFALSQQSSYLKRISSFRTKEVRRALGNPDDRLSHRACCGWLHSAGLTMPLVQLWVSRSTGPLRAAGAST